MTRPLQRLDGTPADVHERTTGRRKPGCRTTVTRACVVTGCKNTHRTNPGFHPLCKAHRDRYERMESPFKRICTRCWRRYDRADLGGPRLCDTCETDRQADLVRESERRRVRVLALVRLLLPADRAVVVAELHQ